ncbi:hypothetical protein HDV05_001397 [Chytridiales sp. JEL 0842]|nr:hypothetical protein HDV05_001397 [Chytridiales sp. JEL 0842]
MAPNKTTNNSKAPNAKEVAIVKDLCTQLQHLSVAQRKETQSRGYADLADLRKLCDNFKLDDELKQIEMETVAAIVHSSTRKQILKSHFMTHMSDEKELATTLQLHRDEFSHFIWRRRINSRKELRSLFQSGMGDLVSEASLEGLQLFEKTNSIRLCKEAIRWQICELDDIASYFSRRASLLAPQPAAPVSVNTNRLEFSVADKVPPNSSWGCVYATQGAWNLRLLSKPMVLNMLQQTLDRLRFETNADKVSYVCTLARILDLAHPSHQLQSSVLAFPLNANYILKRRLVALGYDISPAAEDNSSIDEKFSIDILKQIIWKLHGEQRFYFELTAPEKAVWRAGFVTTANYKESEYSHYPGEDDQSFGFGSDGSIYYKGVSYPYIPQKEDRKRSNGFKTWGIIVDLYYGALSLVVDGREYPPGFGRGAKAFPLDVQDAQRALLLATNLIPMFSLFVGDNQSVYIDRPIIVVNFGRTPFQHSVHACAFDNVFPQDSLKGLDVNIVDSYLSDTRQNSNQEEEEKLQLAAEKNYFRAAVLPETIRSFSQFPPSIYRRSLACTKIQRCWRRHRGRKARAILRERQYAAATLIQHYARRKLRQLRIRKNEAAHIIQRNWRRRLFIKFALMRCIYQQPLPELHRAATVIQTKWRNFSMFRNSPIATMYNARMEDIIKAVNTIIKWWRPMFQQISETRRLRDKNVAATTIQRVWRGYYLRKLIRPDLRAKLRELGESIANHRHELFRVRAAYILQNAWRNYVQRRIKAEKIKTRNKATAKIQALWKGYWVRSQAANELVQSKGWLGRGSPDALQQQKIAKSLRKLNNERVEQRSRFESMEETLYPVAVLIDELKHDDVTLRLNAVRRLGTIALALGPDRTREELIPFLDESIDDEDEILFALADELGSFVDYVGGPSYAHLILVPLENLAAVEETVVREKAVESIAKVAASLAGSQVEDFYLPMVKRLSMGDWFTSRTSACGIFAPIYQVSSPTLQAELRKLYGQLCHDDTPMVRRAAATHLAKLVKKVQKEHVIGELLPLFVSLAQDEQDSVRLLTVDVMIAIAEALVAEENKRLLLNTVRTLLSDKSWRVRYMAAEKFVLLSKALGTEIIHEELNGAYVNLLKDTEAEVRIAAASQIPGFSVLTDKESVLNEILPCVKELVSDPSQHVRASVATQISGMSSILGKDKSVDPSQYSSFLALTIIFGSTIEHLLPLFLQLLKDEASEVRLNIISKMDKVNEVIGIDLLSQSLLPAIVELAEDKQWRVRLAIIENIPLLAGQLGVEFFNEKLSTLCMSWLSDSVYSIREAATLNLKNLAEIFGPEWTKKSIIPKVLAMGQNSNYLNRLTMVFSLTTIAHAVKGDSLKDVIAPTLCNLGSDPIPNIRFNVAKALEQVIPLTKKADVPSVATDLIKPLLTKMAEDSDADVRFYSQKALALI